MYQPEVREEKTKKNVSSDLHFYSYMKKLQQNKNINPLQTSQKSFPIENIQILNQSSRNLQQSQQPQALAPINDSFATNSKYQIPTAESKTVDFWDVVANFDKKQNDLQNEINSFQHLPLVPPLRETKTIEIKQIKEQDSENTFNKSLQLQYQIPTLDSERREDRPFIRKTETVVLSFDKDPNFLEGVIAEKNQEIENIRMENSNLIEIKAKLENALILQNDLMNDLKKQMIDLKEKETKDNIKHVESQIIERKIIRQKCPNSSPDDIHFLTWNSKRKTHSNCSKCQLFKSCRWICKFCDDNFCIGCVPDCIFDGKCYLQHTLQEEMLSASRECDRCGISDANSLYWTDNECALDICKACFLDLDKNSSGNFIVNCNDDFKAFFTVELNDLMIKKYDKKEEKKNMNNIESNSYMFLTIFLMMYVPFFFLFLGKLLKLFFPFEMSFWRKETEQNIPEDEKKLLGIKEKTCISYYKQNFSKDNLSFLLKLLTVLICFTLLIAPSCLVITIQIWCLMAFENQDETIIFDNFFVLKYLIIWIFILMICQEASKTINSVYFVASMYVFDNFLQLITLICSLIPLFSFLLIIWYLCYFNMISIIGDGDLIDVIQNFAGFFILLEFGKIVLQFLKSIHFNDLFLRITSSDLIKISLTVGGLNFKVEKTLSCILNEDEFFMEEIYTELKNKTIFFQYSKISFILLGILVTNYFFYLHIIPK